MLKISSPGSSAKTFFTSLNNNMKKLEKAILQQVMETKLKTHLNL